MQSLQNHLQALLYMTDSQDSEATILIVTVYYRKKIQIKSAKGKTSGLKSRRNKKQASRCPIPGESDGHI